MRSLNQPRLAEAEDGLRVLMFLLIEITMVFDMHNTINQGQSLCIQLLRGVITITYLVVEYRIDHLDIVQLVLFLDSSLCFFTTCLVEVGPFKHPILPLDSQ